MTPLGLHPRFPRLRLLRRGIALALLLGAAAVHAEEQQGIYDPQTGYFAATPGDRFAKINEKLRAAEVALDGADENIVLRKLLDELQVPVASQMLVYSVTSLQKNLISPRRPRALYFNDDTYVAYVPGGRVEIISVDPTFGPIFYISDRVRGGQTPRVQRSEECMNCHAPHYLENIPALVLESVVPGLTGGGERAFRREQSGHGIPLSLRFGGWHLTGVGPTFPQNWSNKLIDRRDGEAHEVANPIGSLFDAGQYLAATSGALPQLLQEHQVGFVNRATLAAYRTRRLQRSDGGAASKKAELTALAEPLVSYLLFSEEVALPTGSVLSDPAFVTAFAANRQPDSSGAALKDLDLQTRLFRYRCSYMIYSPSFVGLPTELKAEVYGQLEQILRGDGGPKYAYLPPAERAAIASILRATLPELPPGWGLAAGAG